MGAIGARGMVVHGGLVVPAETGRRKVSTSAQVGKVRRGICSSKWVGGEQQPPAQADVRSYRAQAALGVFLGRWRRWQHRGGQKSFAGGRVGLRAKREEEQQILILSSGRHGRFSNTASITKNSGHRQHQCDASEASLALGT